MTNKSFRDYINLIENSQQAAEGEKKLHPETWHDVDKKLGKATDKMSQAEKVKKGLAHPDTLKKKGMAEGSTTRGGFGGSAGQAQHEIEWLKKKIASLPPTKEKQIRDLQRQIRERELAIAFQKEGVAEGPGFDKWADDRAASQLHKLKPATTWEVSYDYGPHMSKSITVKARSEEEARVKVEKAAEKRGLSIVINSVEPTE